jgi:hypothetical protein
VKDLSKELFEVFFFEKNRDRAIVFVDGERILRFFDNSREGEHVISQDASTSSRKHLPQARMTTPKSKVMLQKLKSKLPITASESRSSLNHPKGSQALYQTYPSTRSRT